ncbi:MAG: ATP-binding protein [Candidatus Riflebacteria bacterium]
MLEVLFNSLLEQPWYFYYFTGILLLLVGAVFQVIPGTIRKLHHFHLLSASLVIFGTSKLFKSLFLVVNVFEFDFLQLSLQVLWLVVLAEFIRSNWKSAFGFSLPPMIHIPLALILITTAFFTHDLCFGIGGLPAMLMAWIIGYQFYHGMSRVNHPKMGHAGRALVFLSVIFSLQTILSIFLSSSSVMVRSEIENYSVSPAEIIQLLGLILGCSLILLVRKIHHRNFSKVEDQWRFVSPVTLVIILIATNFAGSILTRLMINRESKRIQTRLEQSKQGLEKLISQRMIFASTSSSLISNTPVIEDYLVDQSKFNSERVEKFLAGFAQSFPDGICYIKNREGLVLTSSGKKELFVGRYLNFRSYFKAAMSGQNGRLIDFGKFTNELGFYSAHPVKNPANGEIIGVCTVKRNMNDLTGYLNLYHPSMLVDHTGKIFLASRPDIVGKTLKIVEPAELNEVNRGKDEIFYVSLRNFFFESFEIDPDGWRVLVIGDAQLIRTLKIYSFFSLLSFSLIIIVFFVNGEKRLELLEAQKSALNQFESVFYNAPEGILIISATDQKILMANQGFKQMFKLDKNPVDFFYRDFLASSKPSFAQATHDLRQHSFSHEREFVRADKTAFFAEVNGTSTFFDQQRAVILFLRDITSRIIYENDLMKARAEAEKTSQIKSRFLANTSHEIRTPLTAIIGLNEVARKLCRCEEPKKHLELAYVSARSLLDILNDILDLSQIEAGKLRFEFREFNLKKVLQQLIDIVKIRVEQKKIKTSLKFDHRLPEQIISDGNRLRQIFSNLLSNAVRFTDSGEIEVEAKLVHREGNNLRIQIVVKDTGVGISEDLVDELFGDYVHSDPPNPDDAPGTGLGLSISKQIVERLKGKIHLESAPNLGTRIFVDFPAENAIVSGLNAVQEKKIQLTVNGKPLKILVADDNETNLFLARSIILENRGQADCAKDGIEALELLKSGHYDLALFDIMMPNLDGLELIKEVRSSVASYSILPIIALSAFSTDEERQKAISAGADSYLAKPYFPNDLISSITRAIRVKLDEFAGTSAVDKTDISPSAGTEESNGLKQINLKELEIRILQKPENILQVSQIFSRRSQALTDAITDSVKAGDVQKLRESAHSIKGLAGMLAASKAFSQALEVEKLARDGNFDAAAELVPLLIDQVGEIGADLEIICRDIEARS